MSIKHTMNWSQPWKLPRHIWRLQTVEIRLLLNGYRFDSKSPFLYTQTRARSFLPVVGGGGGTADGGWARNGGGGGEPLPVDEPVVWGGGPWFNPEAPSGEGGGGPWGDGGEVGSPKLLNVEPVGGTEGGGLLLAKLLSPEPPVGGVLLAKLLNVELPVGGWVGGVLNAKALKFTAPLGDEPCKGGGPWLGGGVNPRGGVGGAAPLTMPVVAPVGGVAPVRCMLGAIAGGANGGTPAYQTTGSTLICDGLSSSRRWCTWIITAGRSDVPVKPDYSLIPREPHSAKLWLLHAVCEGQENVSKKVPGSLVTCRLLSGQHNLVAQNSLRCFL